MTQQRVKFFSDGMRLEGLIHLPDQFGPDALGRDVPRPGVIVNHGRFGIKEWVPSKWLPYLVSAGFAGLSFDYRNLGQSEGERGRIIPREQVRDLRHAMTFFQQQPCVDPDRIGVLGWGLGGGIAVATAAEDDRFRAVCCASGLVDGLSYGKHSLSEQQWQQRQDDIAADRIRRVLSGWSRRISRSQLLYDGSRHDSTHDGADDGARHYGWQESLQAALGDERGSDPSALGIPEAMTLESLEELYAFRPISVVHLISPRPLLVIHAIDDGGFPYADAVTMYQLAGEPKKLISVEGSDHRDWIDPAFPQQRRYVPAVVRWFADALGAPGTSKSSPEVGRDV